jgi:hypothetical protein
MRMTKQRPFLEAQNFHHKLQILLEAIIGCKSSSETRRSHDYFQYDQGMVQANVGQKHLNRNILRHFFYRSCAS